MSGFTTSMTLPRRAAAAVKWSYLGRYGFANHNPRGTYLHRCGIRTQRPWWPNKNKALRCNPYRCQY